MPRGSSARPPCAPRPTRAPPSDAARRRDRVGAWPGPMHRSRRPARRGRRTLAARPPTQPAQRRGRMGRRRPRPPAPQPVAGVDLTRTRTVRCTAAGTSPVASPPSSASPARPHRAVFAVYERARQPDPSAFIGPWALHLTAHSNVLRNYGGGPGRIAIHGRSGASLRDPLGSGRSHGCVRVANSDIRWLARKLRSARLCTSGAEVVEAVEAQTEAAATAKAPA